MSNHNPSELVIYCDESDDKGKYYSNFYGGVLIKYQDLEHVRNVIANKKIALNLHGEVKWTKITEHYQGKYIELIDTLFDLIEAGYLKVRIMFTQNIYLPQELTEYHREHEYFLLYYQFLKHAFGLQHANSNDQTIKLRLYFDRLPDTDEKAALFKSYLENLSLFTPFKRAKILIQKNQMAEVESHAHPILQCLDILLGAIQFRLNDKHKEKPDGARVRGKRTRAKEAVYKHINARIRKIYPGFNIGSTTGRRQESENLWHDLYRHWCFRAANHTADFTKGKRQTKK